MFSSTNDIYTSNYSTKTVEVLPFKCNSCSLIHLVSNCLISVWFGQLITYEVILYIKHYMSGGKSFIHKTYIFLLKKNIYILVCGIHILGSTCCKVFFFSTCLQPNYILPDLVKSEYIFCNYKFLIQAQLYKNIHWYTDVQLLPGNEIFIGK